MKTALITGITGQDGPYLAAHLTELGYRVVGMLRGHDNPKAPAVRALVPSIEFVEGDLLDQVSLIRVLDEVKPQEVYNLAAMSAVPISWKQTELVTQINGVGVWRLLEAIRLVLGKETGFFQASSVEVFGDVLETPQDENLPIRPRNPYGIAKAYAHQMVVNYRQQQGFRACCGILFPHESLRRGQEFVTRKVTRGAAKIKLGLAQELRIGNLQAQRDWGYAPDFVRAYHLMLQQETVDDFLLGTGVLHTIEDLLEIAFGRLGLNWRDHTHVDPRFWRPPEQFPMRANAARAQSVLGWSPTVSFEEMIAEMVDGDLAELQASVR